MEMPVTVIGEPHWYSSFNVENTVVDTIAVYTYRCQSCDNRMDCQHVKMVETYVSKELDKLSST